MARFRWEASACSVDSKEVCGWMKKAGNWYRENLDEIGALCVIPEQTPRESTRDLFMDETPVERVGFIEVVTQVVEKEGLEGVRFIGLIGVCRGNRRIRVAKYRLFQTQVEKPLAFCISVPAGNYVSEPRGRRRARRRRRRRRL